MAPTNRTSTPKTAPATGAPRTAAKPAPIPQITSFFPVVAVHVQDPGKGGCQPASDLGAGTYLAGGASGGDGHDGGEELRRYYLKPDPAVAFVYRLDDLLRSVSHGVPCDVPHDDRTDKQAQGQEKQVERNPLRLGGGTGQEMEKQGRGAPRRHADTGGQGHPFQETDKENRFLDEFNLHGGSIAQSRHDRNCLRVWESRCRFSAAGGIRR
jgi:hypothetical protein